MKSYKGYIFILFGTIFWGISATIAKFLYTKQVETLILVQTRVTISAILIFVFFLIFKRELLKIQFTHLFSFVLLGVIGVAMSNFTYYFTIQQTNVSTAILLQYMAPLLVLLYAAFTKEESLSWIKIAAAFISISGCFLAVAGKEFSFIHVSRLGLIVGVASAFCWAFANVYLRHILINYSVWTIIVYSFLAASIFWLFVNPPWVIIEAKYTPELWGMFFGFAIISVLIPHSFYFSGLRYITASRAIITGTFEPIVAIISSYLFLHHILDEIQIFGAVMVVAAIVLLQMKKEKFQEIKIQNQ